MSASDLVRRAASTRNPLVAAFRHTGADVPFGDALPSHGTEMEGWFWRVTDPASGRVVVALCGVNRHPAGDWATVAVALHPGGVVRAAALDGAQADQARFDLRAGTSADARLEASEDRLRVDLDDVHLDLRFADSFVWPRLFGGGGVFSAVPFLNQYWHPHRLGGVVVRLGDRVIRITPPSPVRSEMTDGRWTMRARSLRHQVDLDGDGAGQEPHVLPVPLPAERRNVDTDFEHLAGRLRCVVREHGRVVFDGTSELAGLEVGSLPGHE